MAAIQAHNVGPDQGRAVSPDRNGPNVLYMTEDHRYPTQKSNPSVHASAKVSNGVAALRAFTTEDVDAIVEYWFTSGHDFLDFMGIDRKRLGTMEDTRQRLLHAIWTGDANQKNRCFGDHTRQ
jgi:hypothetical protein